MKVRGQGQLQGSSLPCLSEYGDAAGWRAVCLTKKPYCIVFLIKNSGLWLKYVWNEEIVEDNLNELPKASGFLIWLNGEHACWVYEPYHICY